MKKKNLKSLLLNKKSVSNLNGVQNVYGGNKQPDNSISCQPVGICDPTTGTSGANTDDCGGTGTGLSNACNTNQEGCTIPTYSVFIC
ncbi:hypothetical protein [Kordia sp.]|uniref:hypothetical protein n=1 Tax=Kordia sp. TaxID=1965332 RepID=UPI003B59C98D